MFDKTLPNLVFTPCLDKSGSVHANYKDWSVVSVQGLYGVTGPGFNPGGLLTLGEVLVRISKLEENAIW